MENYGMELNVQLPADTTEFSVPPPGYDTLVHNNVATMNPSLSTGHNNLNLLVASSSTISSADAREYLVDYICTQSCHGKSAAREMNLNNILSSHGLHYTVETFTESRSTERTHEPFHGDQIDGPSNGAPPTTWDIDVRPEQDFVDKTKTLKVPHTDEIKTCHHCNGVGILTCDECDALGTKRCVLCTGNGVIFTDKGKSKKCKQCVGAGRIKCITCNGSGHCKCSVCLSFKQLRWFISLTVKFVNHVDDDVIQHLTNLPTEYFRNVSGDRVLQEESMALTPLAIVNDEQLNECSRRLIEKHRMAFEAERVLLQRHTLRAIPLSEIHWTWKSKASRFWIYGYENRIYCPKYPQSQCWGCTVL